MKQKIYVVKRQTVLDVIEQSQSTKLPYRYDWGVATSAQQIKDAVNTVKRYPNDTLNMAALAHCWKQFYTAKMPAGANRMLDRVWALISSHREALDLTTDKISV